VARKIARLIGLALLAWAGLAVAEHETTTPRSPQTPWYQLSPEERRILAPVAPEWDHLPGEQQQRLKGAARKYPSMRPIQKERFEARVRDWAAMTPEQRRQARETFKGLRQLPPEKQHELRERWLERQRSGEPRAPRNGGSSYREYRERSGESPYRDRPSEGSYYRDRPGEGRGRR
jgi:hypothetical protein